MTDCYDVKDITVKLNTLRVIRPHGHHVGDRASSRYT
jgi:hypothetical protein